MKTLYIILALICTPILAHEGHDHGPKSVQAPKGGIIRSLETIHLELVTEGKTINIYVYDKNLKPADVKNFPANLTVTLPKKKSESLQLASKGDHWEAIFDSKNSHRFVLQLSIKQGGHDDKVKWTVEPKRK